MTSKSIIVVGMHRSGTSAISGLLAELGVFMGGALYGPQSGVNEKGFYENSLVVELNETLLDKMHWSWDDPLAECCQALCTDIPQKTYDDATALLKKDYAGKTSWGMKDPRTSLLLPFWRRVLSALGSEVCYLLMVRSPLEVAGSLSKRDGFSVDKSIMLWLNYTFSSYFQCHDQNLVVLSYDQLLTNPTASAEKIQQAFGLSFDKSKQDISFIDKKMKNQKETEVVQSPLVDLANKLYQQLQSDSFTHQDIVDFYEQYQDFKQSLSPVLIEHLQSVKKDEVHFRSVFLEAYNSVWWKVSWPLKKLENFIRKSKR